MIELTSDFPEVSDELAYVTVPKLTGYDTRDYELITTTNAVGIQVYQMRNKRFGVVEYEDHQLSRILNMMRDMQTALLTSVKGYQPTFLTVVERGDEEGEPSLH